MPFKHYPSCGGMFCNLTFNKSCKQNKKITFLFDTRLAVNVHLFLKIKAQPS